MRDTADVYALLFVSVGCRVSCAYDGLTALALAKVTKPDLAILNYLMPGMTGLEVLKELRAAGNTSKVILTSGASRKGFAQLTALARLEGAQECLRQPCLTEELLGAASRAIPIRRLLRND